MRVLNNFLEASRIKLKVQTSVGILSVEQLWDLSLPKLEAAIRQVKKTLKKEDELELDNDLDFLDSKQTVDKIKQLSFDILKEIYLTKKEELEAEKNALSTKEHNEKIMRLIHDKQENELAGKSVDELMKMLK